MSGLALLRLCTRRSTGAWAKYSEQGWAHKLTMIAEPLDRVGLRGLVLA